MKFTPRQRKVTNRGLGWAVPNIDGGSSGHRTQLPRLECFSLHRALAPICTRTHPKSRPRERSDLSGKPAGPCRMGPTSPASTSQLGRESASLRNSGDYRPPNRRQRSHRSRHLLLGPPGTRGRTHSGYLLHPHPRLRCELGRNAHYLLLASITDQSPIRTKPTGCAPTGRTLFTCATVDVSATRESTQKVTTSRAAPETVCIKPSSNSLLSDNQLNVN